MPDSVPHIALVLLNYNGRHLMQAYLSSVMSVTWPNKSVWVIDNASTDDSLSWLQEKYPGVRQVALTENLGFAGGYNQGLRAIQADFFVLLNTDVEVTPDFLEPMVGAMQADAQLGICQPKIRSLRQRDQFEYAGAAGGYIDALGYPFCRGRIFDTVEADSGQYDGPPHPIAWASGACLMIRKDVWQQLGGFYDYYFMHQEEIDLCWRAACLGYRIVAMTNSVVYHLGGASLAAENPRKTYYNFRNNLVMLSRNLPAAVKWKVIPARLLLDGMAALQMLFRGKLGDSWAVIRGWAAWFRWSLADSGPSDKVKFDPKKLPGHYPGSVVWQYFVKGRKTWTAVIRAGRFRPPAG